MKQTSTPFKAAFLLCAFFLALFTIQAQTIPNTTPSIGPLVRYTLVTGDELTNTSTIQSTDTNAVEVHSGPVIIDNSASGTILGKLNGIFSKPLTATEIVEIKNSGTITGSDKDAISIDGAAKITNNMTGQIKGYEAGIRIEKGGTVVNSGTITGNSGVAVSFVNLGCTLTLNDGSVLNGSAVSTNPTNVVNLEGTGTNTEDDDFLGFGTLNKNGSGTWTLSGTADFATINVNLGMLKLGATAVLSGTPNLTVFSGATLDIGTLKNLSVNNLNFNNGSTLRIDVAGLSNGVYNLFTATATTFGSYTPVFVNTNPNCTYKLIQTATTLQLVVVEFCGGNGTTPNPYQICTAEQLDFVRYFLDQNFILKTDINLSSFIATKYPTDGWLPIGSNVVGNRFTGTLNGKGFKVYNLHINRPSTDYVGLFGYTISGKIDSLGVEIAAGDSVKGQNYVGGLLGYNNVTISNCYASGKVSGNNIIGGLAGNNTANISNCYATGNVSGTSANAYVGGLVGNNTANISNCYATSNVSGTGATANIGGLVGNSGSTSNISNCYATGNVSGTGVTANVGGLVGNNTANISNCYATSNVSGTNGSARVGGLVGYNATGTITNCVAANDSITGTVANRIAGANDPGSTLSNNYANSAMIVNNLPFSGTAAHDNVNGASASLPSLKTFAFYNNTPTIPNWTAWDIDQAANAGKAWRICPNGILPYLQWEPAKTCPQLFCGGAGTPTNPYQICSARQLDSVRYYLSSHFVLNDNIDLKDFIDLNDPTNGWLPIGTSATPFTGTLNGKGHKVYNLWINRPTTDFVGLFGYSTTTAKIDSLGVEIAAGDSIKGQVRVGGLVGINNTGSTISACYVTGNVCGAGNYVGGLAGGNHGPISNCYATGKVSGNNGIGGLLGYSYATISNCYATGKVRGNNNVGGLVGSNSSNITNCVAANDSITGVTNTNRITGSGGTITYCYANQAMIVNNVLGTSGTTGDVNGANKSLTVLKSIAFYNTGSNWSGGTPWSIANVAASTIWRICPTGSFPYFQWQPAVVCPAVIIPSFCGGTGIPSDPYKICTAAQLDSVRYFLDKHFVLNDDIDLKDFIDLNNPTNGWLPIGTLATPFTGTLHGDKHVITNLWINSTGTDDVGLFGYTDGASIDNVGLKIDAKGIKGANNVGGLAGNSNNTTLSQCYVLGNGTVEGTSHIGGLVGNNTEHATITNCYAMVKVSGTNEVGGLTGYNSGNAAITNCYAAGPVTGSSATGGLVGKNENATITSGFSDLNATGQTEGVGVIAGTGAVLDTALSTIVMQIQATFSSWNFSGIWTIWETKSYPHLQWQSAPVFNVTTFPAEATFELLNAADSVVVTIYRGGTVVGTNKYASQPAGINIQTPATIIGDSLVFTVYEHNKTFSYPVSSITQPKPLICGGSGTLLDPYQICTAGQLDSVRYNLTAHYILMTDLDIEAYSAKWGAAGWLPIGTSSQPFRGTFRGAGHVITGLWINRTTFYLGLFGYVINGKIDSLGIEIADANIKGSSYIGGLAGWIDNTTITQCYAIGNMITTGGAVGGLVGVSETNSSITLCYAAVNIVETGWSTGYYLGGLVGNNGASTSTVTITNCYATGNIIGGDIRGGGLAGVNYGTISNCYATGNVKGGSAYTSRIGGLVGESYSSATIQNCVAANDTISFNYAAGTDINRIVGNNSGTFINNYANEDMVVLRSGVLFTALGTHAANQRAGADKPLADLKTLDFYNTTTGTWTAWDIALGINPSKIWGVCGDFPFLQWQGEVAAACTSTITATAGSNGTITPAGAVEVTYNNSQNFIFTPNTGYHIDSVYVNGAPISPAGGGGGWNYTFFNVTGDSTIHVTFAIDTFKIVATHGANGIIDPEGEIKVTYGANQKFTFTPNTGYHVDSVFVNGALVSPAGGGGYTFTNVKNDAKIHVTFARNSYTITATATPDNRGFIDPSGVTTVLYGEDLSFTFGANSLYLIDQVLIDGVNDPVAVANLAYTFTFIEDNHTIEVIFACPPICPDLINHDDYHVIDVAGLCWTKENLRARLDPDGNPIAFAKPYEHVQYPDVTQNEDNFGLLYDWYSTVGEMRASPVSSICPDGWRLPTSAELLLLNMHPADDLRNPNYWLKSNSSTNLTDFDSRGAGYYNSALNRFDDLYGYTAYWSSDTVTTENTCNAGCLTYYCNKLEIKELKLTDGASVRCVVND